MSLLAWIVFGAIAGWIASSITRTNEGLIGNIIVGIIGAVLGGYLMEATGNSGVSGFNLYSLLVSIVGAVILLAIVGFFRRGRATNTRGL